MHKVEQNYTHTHTHTNTHTHTKTPPSVPSSNAYSFSNFFSMQVLFGCSLIKGREKKKKKESGDSTENGICGCGLPARCCQPAVAGSIIYADLWGELNTHLAPQSLFIQSFPVREPLLQAFPFPSTLGKLTQHPHSQACIFIYSSCGRWFFPPLLCSFPPTATFTSFPAPDYWAVLLLLPAAMFVYSSHEKWVFPPLLWSFPPSTTLTSFPTPCCWACTPAPTRASLAHPACLFSVLGRIPFPQSSALSAPHPLFHVSLLFLLLITQFLFFPRVEVSLSRELCCSGPGLSVGVPQYCEAHLVRVFPSCLGASDWWPGGPPGFSV
jgi:hypothetical protein